MGSAYSVLRVHRSVFAGRISNIKQQILNKVFFKTKKSEQSTRKKNLEILTASDLYYRDINQHKKKQNLSQEK
jgi:predicted MPP superfamily phosphohydrolase